MLAVFDTTRAASETVSAIIAGGTVPAALEMMDGMSARAVEQGLHVGFPMDAGAVLLIELEGVREGFDEDPRSDLSVVLADPSGGSWPSSAGTVRTAVRPPTTASRSDVRMPRATPPSPSAQ